MSRKLLSVKDRSGAETIVTSTAKTPPSEDSLAKAREALGERRSPRTRPNGITVFDPGQAAAFLGIGRRRIHKLIKDGALSCRVLGPRTKRIALSDLRAFAAGKRQKPRS